jgi:hypothetical protein
MNDIAENTSVRSIETLAHEITVRAKKCKIACNNDPLRGDFRVQFRPLWRDVSASFLLALGGLEGLAGDDWRGHDRGDTTRLF